MTTRDSLTVGGVFVPTVTPLTPDGGVDASGMAALIEHLAGAGIPALFLLGTTGEAASLSREKRIETVKVAVGANKGRMAIHVGVSHDSIETSILFAHACADLGADAVFAHPPTIYPLTPYMIYHWFKELADASPLPVIVYNIPLTTHVSIPVEVLIDLASHPNIIGMKDSENDPERMRTILEATNKMPDFVYLGGCGPLMPEALLLGAEGIVPSTANLDPRLYLEMCDQGQAGNREALMAVRERAAGLSGLYQSDRTLSEALAGLKAMLEAAGICRRHVAPPLRAFEGDLDATVMMAARASCT